MKKTMIFMVLILILITGCSSKEESITKFSKNYDTYINNSEISKTYQVLLYHNKDIMDKVVVIEKYTLKNGTSDDLKFAADMMKDTFSNEKFDVDGFSYLYDLTDTTFTLTITYDYSEMDIKALIEEDSELVNKDYINNDFQVMYESLFKAYKDSGLIVKE